MKVGTRVKVRSGSYAGRIGVVEMHGLDGVAVRLEADMPGWPFPQVRVIPAAHLVRVRAARRSAVPDAPSALF